MDADLQIHIRNEISNALVTSQNNMMSEIKNLLSNEMGKISSQQKEIADSQMIKIESTLTDDYKFRKRGNAEQFKHHRQVLSKLKEADSQLKLGSIGEDNITAAKEKSAEGIHLVCH
jgi:hypothetical protein